MNELGNLKITWVDSKQVDFIDSIPEIDAEAYVKQLRRRNPKLWISGDWVDEDGKEVSFDAQWEDDDFSDWTDVDDYEDNKEESNGH